MYNPREPVTPLNPNDIRWGDSKTLSVNIPAAGAPAGPFFSGTGPNDFVQVCDIRTLAQTWSLMLALNWTTQAAGDAADSLLADFFLVFGVGSTDLTTFRLLTVPQPAPLSIVDVIVPAFPAEKITVGVRLRVQTAAAGAARVYQGTVGAIAAPYVRTDGTEKVLSKYLLSWAKKAGIKVAL